VRYFLFYYQKEGCTVTKMSGKGISTDGKTLTQYLAGTDYALSGIAVERNGHML
jgi:hypothetical protein